MDNIVVYTAEGLFTPPIPIGIGDKYNDPPKPWHGETKGKRQFGVAKGLNDKYTSFYSGVPFIEPKKETLRSTGFFCPSTKVIGAPIPYINDGKYELYPKRDNKRLHEPKQILTTPVIKEFSSIRYTPSEYDAAALKEKVSLFTNAS